MVRSGRSPKRRAREAAGVHGTCWWGGGVAARGTRAADRAERRVGILVPYPSSDAEIQTRIQVFRGELARLGWSEGVNVQFDERWTTDNMDLVRADATDLVALNPDVILISGDRVIPISAKLTSSIPIVVAITTNPLASGAVESLARPGGNVTGFSNIELSIFGKLDRSIEAGCPRRRPCRYDVQSRQSPWGSLSAFV